jgi:hypothetical protein
MYAIGTSPSHPLSMPLKPKRQYFNSYSHLLDDDRAHLRYPIPLARLEEAWH